MASDLVQVHERYRERGVTFVSLTSDPQVSAEEFVSKNSIPWPCGFKVPRNVIASWGATNSGAAGYESAPTLYLVGSDGRIRWSDNRQRMLHKDSAEIITELENELDKAIKESNTARQD